MSNLLDIFGPALIPSFSSTVCCLVARRDFPARDAVLVVIGVLIVGPLLAAGMASASPSSGPLIRSPPRGPTGNSMSLLDWSFLNPLGRAVIATIKTVISLSAITSLLSLSAALVATWVMQVTTHQGRARLVHCAAGLGAAHCTRCACDLSDAQRGDAVHHARPGPGSPIFRSLWRSWPFCSHPACRIFAPRRRVVLMLEIPNKRNRTPNGRPGRMGRG